MSLFAAIAMLAISPSGSSICADVKPVASSMIASQDADRLAHWYMNKLGFRVMRTVHIEGGGSIHLLACGPMMLEIGPASQASPPTPESGLIAGFNKSGLVVADFDAAHALLVEQEVTIRFGPMTDSNGVRLVIFADPDGNLIQLFDRLDLDSTSDE